MLVTLNEVLKDAQARKYAVGLFNTVNTDMLDAAIDAAEEQRSPIVIGTAEVLLPYGELSLIAPALVAKARAARVPVVVHYDHGLTYPRVIEAIRRGFSSVMYDLSALSPERNAAETADLTRTAHAFGVSVEAEIGHVGNADEPADAARYTSPEEAREFAERTGVDALAVAVGTAHGVYKVKPKLDVERLRAIRAATDVPLVLHGGSGLSDEDFRAVVAAGIAKVNIFTDLLAAGARVQSECAAAKIGYLDTRNAQKEAFKQVIAHKMRLFGCAGKA